MEFRRLRPEEPIAGVKFSEKGQLAPSLPENGVGERC